MSREHFSRERTIGQIVLPKRQVRPGSAGGRRAPSHRETVDNIVEQTRLPGHRPAAEIRELLIGS